MIGIVTSRSAREPIAAIPKGADHYRASKPHPAPSDHAGVHQRPCKKSGFECKSMGKPSNGAASGRHHGPRALGVTWVLYYSGGHPPGFPISPLYGSPSCKMNHSAVRNFWLVYLLVSFGTRFVAREQPTFTLLTHKILASNSTSKSANQRVCILSTHFLKPSKTKHFKNLRNWPASSNSRNLQKRGIIYCCWHPTRHRQVEELKKK